MKLLRRILGVIAVLVVVALAALAFTISYDSCTPGSTVASGSDTMQSIVYPCYGSPDVLQLEEVDKPLPADDQVLVKVHAAGVNPLDWHYMRGSPYIMRLMSGVGAPSNQHLGVDFAGTIVSVGKSVTEFKPGDEVFGGASGAFSEYVTVRAGGSVALKPERLTFEQAAAVPIAGVTALQALIDSGQLQAGQKVLINGASGGVGTFAVQIASALGAEVSGVCSTRNVDMVRSLGADHVIDYKREDFTEGEQRYDLIVDNVGNHPLLKLRSVLRPGGRIVIVGGPGGDWVGPLIGPLKAMFLSPFVDEKILNLMAVLEPEDLRTLAEMMRQENVTPVIDRRYPLSEVPDAIRYSEQGRARGKIVITVDQDS